MNPLRFVAGMFSVLMLGGCALFSPYDSEFMCAATDDYGQCMDVQGAYDQAVAGKRRGRRVSGVQGKAGTHGRDSAEPGQLDVEARNYSAYKAAEYREMQKLLEAPVTPLVRPPKVLRTLITAYPGKARTLYTPRYVFYFADEGQFVLGDYLNTPPPNAQAPLGPFGPTHTSDE